MHVIPGTVNSFESKYQEYITIDAHAYHAAPRDASHAAADRRAVGFRRGH